jgi:hypothetical protein
MDQFSMQETAGFGSKFGANQHAPCSWEVDAPCFDLFSMCFFSSIDISPIR